MADRKPEKQSSEAPQLFVCEKDRVEVSRGGWPGTTIRNSLRHAIESCESYGGKCPETCPIKAKRHQLLS
jgi:hypothetical protein